MSFLGDLAKKTQDTIEKTTAQVPSVFVPSPNPPSLEERTDSDATKEALDRLMNNKHTGTLDKSPLYIPVNSHHGVDIGRNMEDQTTCLTFDLDITRFRNCGNGNTASLNLYADNGNVNLHLSFRPHERGLHFAQWYGGKWHEWARVPILALIGGESRYERVVTKLQVSIVYYGDAVDGETLGYLVSFLADYETGDGNLQPTFHKFIRLHPRGRNSIRVVYEGAKSYPLFGDQVQLRCV